MLSHTRIRTCFVSIALYGLTASIHPSAELSAQTELRQLVDAAAATITESDIRRAVGVIAADSMMGRDTPSPGLVRTARYIANRFAAAGLRAGSTRDFLQTFPLTTVRPGPLADQVVSLSGPSGELRLESGEEFVAMPLGGERAGAGSLIRIDDLSDLAGAQGGIAVLKAGMRTMPQVVAGIGNALTGSSVAGVVIVMDMPPQFFQMAKKFFTATGVSLGDDPGSGPPVVVLPLGAVPPELADGLNAAGEFPAEWSANIRTNGTVGAAEGVNTFGLIEGADPDLRDETVLFVAHMDGQGVGDAVAGDSIYNSADDNATGTAVLIEIAEAFAALPERPARSVAFLAVSGEEKNLLGSRWYVDNPIVPLEQTVALINMDMIGRNWTDSVLGIGMEHTTMEEVVLETVASHPELNMGVMRDRWPELNLYARSDSYPFALAGVPVIYFQSRGHQDYHQPTDQADRLDFDKLTRLGRLIFHFAFGVTTMDERPQWLPGAWENISGN